jgi:hypothetical protein
MAVIPEFIFMAGMDFAANAWVAGDSASTYGPKMN